MKAMLLVLLAASFTPVYAYGVSLDLKHRKVITTTGQENVAFNMAINDGVLIYPDMSSNSVQLRALDGSLALDIPLSRQPRQVISVTNTFFAVNDPFDGTLSLVDLSRRQETKRFSYPVAKGPVYITHYNQIIYGTDMYSKTLSRYSLATGRLLPMIESGSGPADLHVLNDTLYVLERGFIGSSADDFVAAYEPKTMQLKTRVKLPESARTMIPAEGNLCIALNSSNEVACGLPELPDNWAYADTGEYPDSLTYGGGYLWVLARGGAEDDSGTLITAYEYANGKLTEVLRQSLDKLEELTNPRTLHYDAASKSLLVRFDYEVVQIPVN